MAQKKVNRSAAQRRVAPAKPATTAKPATKRVAPAPTQVSAPVAATPAVAPDAPKKSIWEEHLQIRLFSEVIGPNLTNSDGAFAYPDANDPNGNYVPGNDPISSWNQISFRWKISDKYHAFINPRFSTHLASTKRIRASNRPSSPAKEGKE